MKEVYIVKLTNGKNFMEFNFNKVTQASEFIHLALLHGNTITVTIEHFPIAEEGEGLKNGIKTNVCDDDNRQRRLP